MIKSLKIINTIAQSFDDNILSIKTELIRVDSQLSFCEVTIDSENNTQLVFITVNKALKRGRFRKRNLKHAKECSIQQRRGFACGVCRWKRRFGCSRNSAVSAARFESGFRERDGQGQHWRGPHSHGGFLKMIVCESGGHANGLTYFIFRFLRRPLITIQNEELRNHNSVLRKK